MCELLGLCFKTPISADFSVHRFALRDVDNADGWGLAWYVDDSLAVVKEPVSWRQSAHATFLEAYDGLRSRIFVGHVRHATVGREPRRCNTHPFDRELFGRFYVFAHNGTIRQHGELPLGLFRPVGRTDSEHVFCHLMHQFACRGGNLEQPDDWIWLHELFQGLNEKGKFNCVLSDGQRLFCYHDAAGFKSLTMRSVGLDDSEVHHLEDPQIQIALGSDLSNRGIVVATAPLTDANWHSFRPGELIVFEDGYLRFSSHRSAEAAVA